jgi:hypothetical protein
MRRRDANPDPKTYSRKTRAQLPRRTTARRLRVLALSAGVSGPGTAVALPAQAPGDNDMSGVLAWLAVAGVVALFVAPLLLGGTGGLAVGAIVWWPQDGRMRQ